MVGKQQRIPESIRNSCSGFLNSIACLPGVSRIILFGSCAKGTQTRESDVDLAVFFSLDKHCLLDEYRQLVRICSSSDMDIQIQAFNEAELDDPCGIIEEILAFGIEISVPMTA
ncbi:MAG: nucleotidyltransferase domain-containing protein [Clostridia bacterium]